VVLTAYQRDTSTSPAARCQKLKHGQRLTAGYRGTADFASLSYYQQQVGVDGYWVLITQLDREKRQGTL